MEYVLHICCYVILMSTSLCLEIFISPDWLLSAETLLPYFPFCWLSYDLGLQSWLDQHCCLTVQPTSLLTVNKAKSKDTTCEGNSYEHKTECFVLSSPIVYGKVAKDNIESLHFLCFRSIIHSSGSREELHCPSSVAMFQKDSLCPQTNIPLNTEF